MRKLLVLGCVLALGLLVRSSIAVEPAEVTLSAKELSRLEIFEERILSEADLLFRGEEYARAREKYSEFVKAHGDSRVAPYAMLRKGRCAELGGDLKAAIKDYEAVAAKYPKLVKYTAPALYYLVNGYRRDGNLEQLTKTKARLADEAYAESAFVKKQVASTQSPSSTNPTTPAPAALVKLTLEQYEQIAQAATDLQDPEAMEAIGQVVRQHLRVKPDEAMLRAFYKKVYKQDPADPKQALDYWLWVHDGIQKNSYFSYNENTQRISFFKHWFEVLKGKYPDSDDYQIGLAKIQYGIERDRTKLTERLDAQYKKGDRGEDKKPDWKRTLKWVLAYKGHYSKTREYVGMFNYEMAGLEGTHGLVTSLCNHKESYLGRSTLNRIRKEIPFDKLTNDDVLDLVVLARETAEDTIAAREIAKHLHFEKMTGEEKLALARKFLKIDDAIASGIYSQLEDQTAAKVELFNHYVATENSTSAIAMADELSKIKELAAVYSLKKAQMLLAAGRHREAIEAYRQCDDSTENMWKIVSCYAALDNVDGAIEQLRAIEKVHKKQAAKAVLQIATFYGEAVEKEKQIEVLRELVAKYPNSPEAKEADGRLGDLGVPPSLPTDTLFELD